MRKLILALAAVALTVAGCSMFDRHPSKAYFHPVSSPGVPATVPAGP